VKGSKRAGASPSVCVPLRVIAGLLEILPLRAGDPYHTGPDVDEAEPDAP